MRCLFCNKEQLTKNEERWGTMFKLLNLRSGMVLDSFSVCPHCRNKTIDETYALLISRSLMRVRKEAQK